MEYALVIDKIARYQVVKSEVRSKRFKSRVVDAMVINELLERGREEVHAEIAKHLFSFSSR